MIQPMTGSPQAASAEPTAAQAGQANPAVQAVRPGAGRRLRGVARAWGRGWGRWWARWWHIVRLGTLLLALSLSVGPWRAGPQRQAISRQVWLATAPLMAGFALGSALMAVVITRIVLVTAQSYGLSQLALEMVVRVLVLELLPLGAALLVALRVALPAAVSVAQLKAEDRLQALRREGVDVLGAELLPRAAGMVFAVLLLVSLNSLICLVVAYLLAHGLSPWGFDSFTRMVGRVFSPAVSLVFVLKTLAFAAAVAVVPMGSALHDPVAPERSAVELSGLVRLFAALLLIEVLSLGINYV